MFCSKQSMIMLRSSSPAMSEISVGSPSPPPRPLLGNGFQVLNIKRLRPNNDLSPQNVQFPQPLALPPPQRRKSSNERVKSFSIADILGNKKEPEDKPSESRHLQTKSRQTPPPLLAAASAIQTPILSSIPTTQLLAERLQPSQSQPAPLLMLHKVLPGTWDPSTHLTPSTNVNPSNLHINPFFPPALLHYEQRLAWDYQRQLQEHFQAQAQLLRQMSMDPNIIPSEDGSERSRSSSAGSQCYSPEVNVAEDDDEDDEEENETEGQRSKSDDRLISNPIKSDKAVKSSSLLKSSDTPLDALFQLSTKNFDEDQDPATLNIFATRPNPKKKRKSRTAFTNHQIFELEKRFLYQKYLSPADRDEIAAGLGLSNAQVITWFQNRRAKLKRDMEELKKDVESVKQLSAHKSLLENVNDLSILKTRPVSRYQPPPTSSPPAAAAPQQHAEVPSAAHTHGNHITGVYTTAATGGLSEIIQQNGNKTTIPEAVLQQQHHPTQNNNNITPTTNTCNERRDGNDLSINSTGYEAESVQPQQLQQQQQQPRNLQINSSRG